jgi:hypothetical protein
VLGVKKEVAGEDLAVNLLTAGETTTMEQTALGHYRSHFKVSKVSDEE